MVDARIKYVLHEACENLNTTAQQLGKIQIHNITGTLLAELTDEIELEILHASPIDGSPLSVIISVWKQDLPQLIKELSAVQ